MVYVSQGNGLVPSQWRKFVIDLWLISHLKLGSLEKTVSSLIALWFVLRQPFFCRKNYIINEWQVMSFFFYKNGPKRSYDDKLFLDELQHFWSYHFYIGCKAKFFIYWIYVSLFRPKCKNLGSGVSKGQVMSEYIYEIIDFPKYNRKNLIDFCPESSFRLGMLCTHLSRFVLRIIKTNHIFRWYFGKSMIT